MNKKNTFVSVKKIPYNLALVLLTAGASVILGFLSFSGMYALYPVLAFASATFALSVAYEGEIYLQNLKGALNKLFKNDYLQHRLAKDYLLAHFPANTATKDCPKFFTDYKAQLLLLSQFGHGALTPKSKTKKKQLQKTLNDMERWFAQQLFANKPSQSPYAVQLQDWLAKHQQAEWQTQIKQQAARFNLAKGFSTLAALFMGLGSTYLIVEAFSVIPFFAAIPFAVWPAIILPMSLIAGTAYGLLTYNAVTDLINNNTVLTWYNKLKKDLQQGLSFKTVVLTLTASFLVTLAVALTICTAGTWWTIATNGRPLFSWMSNMPSVIMGVINPIITGASAIFFNIQNSAESLEMVDEAMQSKKSSWQRMSDSITAVWNNVRSTEHWLQIVNPFRLLLKLTVTPLRVLLFLGHLLSIALTSDRMPGVPQIISVLVAIICEGFEDAHYFVGHDHEHAQPHSFKEELKEHLNDASGHSHNTDIPTRLLQIAASPIYALAAGWDVLASRFNKNEATGKKCLSFKEAWNKQYGIDEEKRITLPANAQRPSELWRKEHADTLIERQKTRLTQTWVTPHLAEEKKQQLVQLQQQIRKNKPWELKNILTSEQNKSVYNQHRLFALEAQTSTQQFIAQLPADVGFNRSKQAGA